jgi:hypothetical protein
MRPQLTTETQEQINRRRRNWWLATVLSFAWWVVSIGGVITVIIAQS